MATASPDLGALASNGGPTQTVPLQTGSPALGTGGDVSPLADAVNSTTATTVTVTDADAFSVINLPLLQQLLFSTQPSNAAPGSTLGSVTAQDLNLGVYFDIQIDGEQMAVTGLTLNTIGTATLDVIRGVNGTTAATHSANASVYAVSDQRGEVVVANSPPVVDMGSYQSTGATVTSLAGTPVSGVAVTLNLISSATLGGTTTATTNSSGDATFNNLSVIAAVGNLFVSPVGTYALAASTTGVLGATSNLFSITSSAPAVTALGPDFGPTSGGTTVTINGVNFTGASAVDFGSAAATGVTLVSSTEVTCVSPAGTGTVDVTVTTSAGTSVANAADAFIYGTVTPPTLTAVSPIAGLPGTASVTITGTNFTVDSAVDFGGVAATGVTVLSATRIICTDPVSTGTVDVTVVTPSGTSTSTTNLFTFILPPTLTSISPTSGIQSGGTSVTIIGTNFVDATVDFGSTPTGVTILSETQISCIAPAGTGTVNVTVINPAATSPTSSADQFTYTSPPTVSSVSPNSGSTNGGTPVTITGTNFMGSVAVYFGNTSATGITVVSATEITCNDPAGTGTVNVTVTTGAGTSLTGSANQFTYEAPAPTVLAVSPGSGPTSSGTAVTITGTNFTGATAVAFGGTAATSVTIVSATEITCAGPAGTGTVDVTVTTSAGTSSVSSNDQFTYTSSSLVVTTVSDATTHTGTSLRDAINTANTDAAAGQSVTIAFSPSLDGQTITLAQGTLDLTGGTGTITIDGAGSSIAVSGDGTVGVFSMASGGTFVVSGLTLTGGTDGDSGAVNNSGSLTIDNCAVTGNSGGSAISNTGTFSAIGCNITNNSDTADALSNNATMFLDNCTLADNSGDIDDGEGPLTILNCTFSGTPTSSQEAIYTGFSAGNLTIVNSTITGHSSGSGTIFWEVPNTSSKLTIENSTISGNSIGLHNESGGVTIYMNNTIFAGNQNIDCGSTVTGSNCLIGDGVDSSGIFNDFDGNLVGTSASPINADLASLQNNGGPTQTMMLESGSPALGTGGANTELSAALSSSATTLNIPNGLVFAAITLVGVLFHNPDRWGTDGSHGSNHQRR